MAKKILINEIEFELMEGLSHLAIVLYVMGIRPYMDYATGITGWKRGISYQSLSEEVYIEPVTGRHSAKSGSPSKMAIRNALKELIKHGLVNVIPAGKKLVLKLVEASTDLSVLNMSNTRTTQGSNTRTTQDKPALKQVFTPEPEQHEQHSKNSMSNTPPVSGKDITTTTTVKTSKTYIPKTEQNASGGGGGFDNLIFNKNLGTRSVQAISKLLPQDNPEIAQALLDELSGMMNQQDIKSPTGYFRGIVNRYNAGDFEPTAGVAIAERRQSNARQEQEAKERHKEMTRPAVERVVDKEKLAANRAAMKAALKIKKVTA